MNDQYINFFTASAAAAAALVGLLFVALSIDAHLEEESRTRQFAISENAFIAFAGIFLISLLALLPSLTSLAAVTGVGFALVGIWNLFRRIRHTSGSRVLRMDYFYFVATLLAYLLLAWSGLGMLVGVEASSLSILSISLVLLYGLSLTRAWRALSLTKRERSK